jgi:hypothetical protein
MQDAHTLHMDLNIKKIAQIKFNFLTNRNLCIHSFLMPIMGYIHGG